MKGSVKMKKYLLFTFLSMLILLNFAVSPSSAAEVINNDEVIIDRSDYLLESDFEQVVTKHLNDENITTVTVINTDNTVIAKPGKNDGSLVQPYSMALPYAKNIKYLYQRQGKQLLNTLWGQPGITINLTNSHSASATVSAGFSVDHRMLGGSLGFSTTSTHTVSYSGSYKVPGTVNGRKVSRVKLNAYPVLSIYSFDWYEPERHNLIFTKMVFKGTGTAGKPVGVSYTKTFEYK